MSTSATRTAPPGTPAPPAAPASRPRRRIGRLGPGGLVLPAVAVLGVLFLFPLTRLITDSLQTDSGLSLDRYTALLHDGIFLPVLWRTVEIALSVTVVAAVIGYPFAYAAVRLPTLPAAVLLACVTLPFFSSTLIRSYAWRVLLSDNGLINKAMLAAGLFDSPHQLVFNDTGVIIGMTQVLLPMMVMPLYAAMRGIDRSAVRAARSMGASPFTAWRTVFLPLSVRGLAAGASLVFITSLGYYTTPALLGGASTPMIAQRIDAQINTQQQYGPTAAEAAVLLVLVLILMAFLRRPLGLSLDRTRDRGAGRGWFAGPRRAWRRAADGLSGAADHAVREFAGGAVGRAARRVGDICSTLRYVILGAVTAVAVAGLVGPLVVICMLAFSKADFLTFPPPGYSTRWFSDYFQDADWTQSTVLSLWVSLAAALVATVVGTLAAYGIVRARGRRLPALTYLLTVSPMVMPQIIYAVALFFFLVPLGVLGTPTAILLADTVLALPYVVVVTTAVLRGLDPLHEKAAASLGASPLRVGRTVIAPLAAPGILAALLFAFILAFDDLLMGVFLGGPHTVTLQVRMYQNILFEISPKVAAVGVLLTTGVLLLAGFTFLLSRRGRGTFAGGHLVPETAPPGDTP
ncbi:ABC transporter permease subunit [Streptomyces sp. NPDC005970]|uniref:ABC transporter permease subunit n=1 Tax=Streptomyces sp. NPDC005970 TaxID=3156723 RepID=UPI0033F81B81